MPLRGAQRAASRLLVSTQGNPSSKACEERQCVVSVSNTYTRRAHDWSAKDDPQLNPPRRRHAPFLDSTSRGLGLASAFAFVRSRRSGARVCGQFTAIVGVLHWKPEPAIGRARHLVNPLTFVIQGDFPTLGTVGRVAPIPCQVRVASCACPREGAW